MSKTSSPMDSYNEIEKILEKVEISAKTITDYIKNLVKKFVCPKKKLAIV